MATTKQPKKAAAKKAAAPAAPKVPSIEKQIREAYPAFAEKCPGAMDVDAFIKHLRDDDKLNKEGAQSLSKSVAINSGTTASLFED